MIMVYNIYKQIIPVLVYFCICVRMTADNLSDENMVKIEIQSSKDLFFRQSVATSVPAYHFYLGPVAQSGHFAFQMLSNLIS